MNQLLAFWQRRGTFARILLLFAAVCVLNWTRLALISAGVLPTPAPAPVVQEVAAPATSVPTSITMADYQRLKLGSSYAEAAAVLGGPGTEMSSNDIGGYHTVLYQWRAGLLANLTVTFQNDKLVSKAQFGLK